MLGGGWRRLETVGGGWGRLEDSLILEGEVRAQGRVGGLQAGKATVGRRHRQGARRGDLGRAEPCHWGALGPAKN